MTQKWNLQDIRPAEPRRRRPTPPPNGTQGVTNTMGTPGAPEPIERPPMVATREKIPNIVIEDGNKKDRGRLIWSIVVFVVIVGGAIGLSALMGKTELTVHPKYREPNVNAEFTTYPDKRDKELSYEVMTLESTGEKQVKASGQKDVKEQATGFIEIVKTTPGTERLIKNTRFRSPDGLVFRIKESAIVPGAVTDSSGASVPGTIRAEVFADEVGDKYNLPAGTTFDVPGFKESKLDELYKAITARNPEAFLGGFDGPQFEIDPNELGTARQALQMELRDGLLARIENEKPAGFIAFPDAVAITYNELPAVEYGNDLVTIREQAVLQIPLFQETDFGSYLAQQTVPAYDGEPVRVEDPSVLTFRYVSATSSASVIANEPSLSFSLSGKPLLIWEFDAEKLKTDLAMLPKTTINNAITAYPGIESAVVRITPFWKRSFPEDPSEITIIEELDKKE